jgi:membrane-bound lytic murein transglycosylase D
MAMLLAACSTVAPQQASHRPVVILEPKVVVDHGPPPAAGPATSVQAADLWDQLRGQFAMADCDADPAVLGWARRYTRNTRQFENQMQRILPRLAYVQQLAAQYDVAGEFALLPWVESEFQDVPGRRKRPAGIWQIMTATAGSMGLHVDNRYDARLDLAASSAAVMKLLKMYHDQFHDWRIVDYAYNNGEFKMRQLMQAHGMPATSPVIPKWPVPRVTREHLTKLLAIACVIRTPARFEVNLPVVSANDHLVQVSVPRSMPISEAARHAGMSVDSMKELNAGFRSATIDIGASPYLLLPADHVSQFQTAVRGAPAIATASKASLAETPRPEAANQLTSSKPVHPPRRTHRVKRGESLWQIAHRYSVDVVELQRWNHLRGAALKPGQMLWLNDED